MLDCDWLACLSYALKFHCRHRLSVEKTGARYILNCSDLAQRSSWRHGTLERKGSRISPSHLDILVYISPPSHGRDLKGRQVKVPPSSALRPSFFLAAPGPSIPPVSPSTTAPLCTGPDVALSRARASFFLFFLFFSGRTIGNMWHEG